MTTKDDVAAFLLRLSTPSYKTVQQNGNGHHKPSQAEVDRKVWEEEEAQNGLPVIADIRDPRVRAEVRRIAMQQEQRLEERLIAAGLHVLQKAPRG